MSSIDIDIIENVRGIGELMTFSQKIFLTENLAKIWLHILIFKIPYVKFRRLI